MTRAVQGRSVLERFFFGVDFWHDFSARNVSAAAARNFGGQWFRTSFKHSSTAAHAVGDNVTCAFFRDSPLKDLYTLAEVVTLGESSDRRVDPRLLLVLDQTPDLFGDPTAQRTFMICTIVFWLTCVCSCLTCCSLWSWLGTDDTPEAKKERDDQVVLGVSTNATTLAVPSDWHKV